MVKAAILDDYQNVALKLADWSPVGKDVEVKVFNAPIGDDNDVIKALQGFTIVNMMRERTPFNRKVIEGLPDLKLLITTGARNNSIDLKAAAEHGITVCGTGGFGNPTVAVAIGLMLELTHHIGSENARMNAGAPWQTTIGHDVEGMTLGVLGLGKLGKRVATIAKAFGMKVIAWSQNLTPEKAKEAGADYASKEDLFRNADVVTIHVVLERSLARPGRREGNRADEEDRLSDQHGARADRRREGADRGARTPNRSPAPGSTSSTSSRCRSTIRSARWTMSCSRRTSAMSPNKITASSIPTLSKTSAPGSTASRCACLKANTKGRAAWPRYCRRYRRARIPRSAPCRGIRSPANRTDSRPRT